MKPARLTPLLPPLLLALLLDGLSKAWAERTLPRYEPVPVLGETFRLTLGSNDGLAFGLFSSTGRLPTLLAGLVLAGLLAWSLRALSRGTVGGLANLLDRLPDGRVTDFLDFGIGAARWPTFNPADTFIVVGTAPLLLRAAPQARPDHSGETTGENA